MATIRDAFRFSVTLQKKNRTSRKQPSQSRSRATVETILDGCIRVLDQEGIQAATTSRIAEASGVSVGSLYQYFENRDAILNALQDREFVRTAEMLQTHLLRGKFETPRDLARTVVSSLLALYRSSPGLHRVLALEGLRVAPTDRVQAFDHRIVETLRAFFESTIFAIRRPNKHAAAFVLYQSVRATMLAKILEEPPGLNDEILVEELTELVVSYLI
jgi:AcrR family transcriptional regulator